MHYYIRETAVFENRKFQICFDVIVSLIIWVPKKKICGSLKKSRPKRKERRPEQTILQLPHFLVYLIPPIVWCKYLQQSSIRKEDVEA